MINVQLHLYGKLRKYTDNQNPRKKSVVEVETQKGTTIRELLEKLNIPIEDVGTNIFLNGEYSSLDRPIHGDSRLGVFPDDMDLLYKWHFERKDK